jgi:hypothetical protein
VNADWGDGQTTPLGAITGNAVVAHTYHNVGTYVVTGTLTDSVGNVVTVSTSVTVVPLAAPSINISPSIPSSCTGSGTCNVTIVITVTLPTGVSVTAALVDFGDGTSQGLGGLVGSTTVTHPYKAGIGGVKITVSVTDTTGRTTLGFVTITIP